MKAETEIKPAGHREPVKKTLFVIAIDRGTNSGFIYQKIISHRATEKPVLVLDGQQREELIEYMRGLTQRNYLGRDERARITQLYIPTLSMMCARRNGNVSLTPRGENSQTPARKLK